jgi:ABC-type transporter Mla subunit MlaD
MEFDMPFISDLRGLFKRRRPVEIDLSATQAAGLGPPREWDADTAPNGRDGGLPARGDALARATREAAAGHEIKDVVHRLDEHLSAQTDRADRMLDLMERVPKALDALPEINRQQARLLEILSDHLGRSRNREESLGQAIRELSDASSRQTEVLGLVQQQLDANREAAHTLARTLDNLHESLGRVAHSQSNATETLRGFVSAAEAREAAMAGLLGSIQRWMIVAVACCAAASLVAIVLAVIALV